MAGEGAVALAADVAAHARVDLHVLLEGALRLETLPAQQTEDSHVCACGRQSRESLRELERKAILYPSRLAQGPHQDWRPQAPTLRGESRGGPGQVTLMEHPVCDPVGQNQLPPGTRTPKV